MISFTERQLAIFLAAAQDCHFVRTASRFGITQAAVSHHISAIEAQLGRQLFLRRRGRKPILTDYGQNLLSEARSQAEVREPNRRAQPRPSPADADRRTVSVLAGGHLLNDCIKSRLSEFHARSTLKGVEIDCKTVESPVIGAESIRDGSADLLVFTVANPADLSLRAEILRTVSFGLYASRSFSSIRHAGADELSSMPFLLPPRTSEAARMVESALLAVGLVSRQVPVRSKFASVLKDLAKRGIGIAALFETMIYPEDAKDLIRLDLELPTMYRTLFRANTIQSGAVREVEGFLRTALSE